MTTIRFHERLLRPCAALRRHVSAYTVLTPDRELSEPLSWRILPEASPHLILHVYREASGRTPRLTFVGPRSVYTDVDRTDRTLTLSVTFRPGGAALLAGDAISSFRDAAVPIDDLLGPRGRELADEFGELASRRDLDGCRRLLDATLSARVAATPNPLATAAIDEIVTGRALTVAGLAAGLGVTERHLRNVMGRHVGLGPKRALRVTRVRRALRAAEADRQQRWAAIAATTGYSDQPHLIDEFHALLGDAPSAFVARPHRE